MFLHEAQVYGPIKTWTQYRQDQDNKKKEKEDVSHEKVKRGVEGEKLKFEEWDFFLTRCYFASSVSVLFRKQPILNMQFSYANLTFGPWN